MRFPTFDAVDDRGCEVRVSGPRVGEFVSFRTPVMGPVPRGAAELVQRLAPTREVFAEARPAVGKRGTWLATILAGAFVLGIMILLGALSDIHWSDVGFLVVALVVAAGAAMYGWLEVFGIIRPRKPNLPSTRDLLDMIAREGRCFSCGYPFAGLEPEADGCTRCPECGAAWRLGAGPVLDRLD